MYSSLAIDVGIYALLILLSYFVWRKYGDKIVLRYVYAALALIAITVWQFISANLFEPEGFLQTLNSAAIQIIRISILALLIVLILKRG